MTRLSSLWRDQTESLSSSSPMCSFDTIVVSTGCLLQPGIECTPGVTLLPLYRAGSLIEGGGYLVYCNGSLGVEGGTDG